MINQKLIRNRFRVEIGNKSSRKFNTLTNIKVTLKNLGKMMIFEKTSHPRLFKFQSD